MLFDRPIALIGFGVGLKLVLCLVACCEQRLTMGVTSLDESGDDTIFSTGGVNPATLKILKEPTMEKLNVTRNNLASNTKKTITMLLNARLVDSIDLALMTKQAHWNLRGRQFIAVHEMLDGFRTDIDAHADNLAERIVQLGGIALGTTQAVAKGSKLDPYPDDLISVDDHIAALAERYGDLANAIRSAIATSEEAGDAGTADLLTAFSRSLDKALWFLEAHEADKA